MTTPNEVLAAGIMAKLTGGFLKKVDESTTTPSNSGPANRIDPMAVIRNQALTPQQQQLLRQVNAAAEAAYPLATEHAMPVPAMPSVPAPQQEFDFGPPPSAAAITANNDVTATLKSIDTSIKKLINLLETKWQAN
jgi:hypothetical protein